MKLTSSDRLCGYVQDRLGGKIARLDGTLVDGPDVPFNKRRRGRRQDRRWARSWSPEQIANRHLPTTYIRWTHDLIPELVTATFFDSVEDVVELPTGHCLQWSRPDLVADVLLQRAR